MKFKGVLIGEASGSVAGNTFSRNRGGQYIRMRASPVNPNTIFQQRVRSYMANLVSQWGSLSAQQRDLWNLYAEQVPITDSLGEPRNVGGIGMFTRSNVSRLQHGFAAVLTGPTDYDLGSFTGPTFTVDGALDTVDVSFEPSDDWAGESGAAMLVYASRPQGASINYFSGPYRYAGGIDGDSPAPSSPATLPLPFPVEAGQFVFFQVRVTRADGRLSGTYRDRALVT